MINSLKSTSPKPSKIFVATLIQGSAYSDLNYQDNYLFSEAIKLEQQQEDSEQLLLSDTRLWSGVGDDEDGQVSGITEIPSSNDTKYLITKPIVLNLDSQSSRCNKIKTPLDPSKLNMVDNKQLSALIGCSSGLMIFFCIIISIVARPKKHKDDDIPVPPRSNSLTDGSYKSPSFKSRSGSLVYDKTSYSNSQSSSMTRLNGADHEVRIRKDSCNVSPINKNMADTSRAGTLQRNHKTKHISPKNKKFSQQSSTESGPNHYSKMSRQSSSEASGGAVRKTQTTTNRRSGDYNRRHQQEPNNSRLHDRAATLDRNRKGYGNYRRSYEVNGGNEDCIPMMEYNSTNSSPQQTLHVPRATWTRGSNNGDSGVHSFNNSYDYDHQSDQQDGGYSQNSHQENFLNSRKFDTMHSAQHR